MICGIIKIKIFKFIKISLLINIILIITSIIIIFKPTIIITKISFLNIQSTSLSIRLIFDWISIIFISTVLLISSLIIIFRISYIPRNQHKQFSLFLIIFIISIIILIISDNLFILILGWDGLGLSSYILVIFYQNRSSAASGSITIFSNRIGDIIILISLAILFYSINWQLNFNFPIIIIIFIIIAAISKRAQFPFSAWLPAAIAAPTPISALVHSSTLVTAGVYLLLRVIVNSYPITLTLILIISRITSIFSRLSAIWENDIKKIIAISTLRQIAIIIFSISLGALTITFFHLITHAFFKSSIFLCAGSIIHNSTYQDIRHIGSNFFSSPIQSSILGLNRFALIGLPFISGFFSKDSIIEFIILSKINSFLSILIILSIRITRIYTIRINLKSISFNMLSKPDILFHNQTFITIPILTLRPISIFIGANILWLIIPTQIFFIPPFLKHSIILALSLGVLLAISLSFKNKIYISLTESSISLWFSHFLTSQLLKIINPLTSSSIKNDLTWQEIYGPSSSFYQNIPISSSFSSISSNHLLSLLLISLIPIIIIL